MKWQGSNPGQRQAWPVHSGQLNSGSSWKKIPAHPSPQQEAMMPSPAPGSLGRGLYSCHFILFQLREGSQALGR